MIFNCNELCHELKNESQNFRQMFSVAAIIGWNFYRVTEKRNRNDKGRLANDESNIKLSHEGFHKIILFRIF